MYTTTNEAEDRRVHTTPGKRRRGRSTMAALSAMAVALAAAACGSSSGSSSAAAASGSKAAVSGPVQVGLVILSGPVGDNETSMMQGFTLANKTIVSQKILGGRSIGINKCEDDVNPSLAAQCAHKLLNNGYKIMILDEASPEAVVTQQITERAGVIDVLPSQRGIPAGDGHLAFSTGVSGNIEVHDVAPQIVSSIKPKTIAILAEDNNFGQAEDTAFQQYFASHGVNVVYNSTFATSQTDFTSDLTTISSKSPDAVVMIGEANQGVAAAKDAQSLGFKTPLIMSSGMTGPALLQGAQGAMEGNYAWSTLPFPSTPAGKKFFQLYQNAYHSTPPPAIAGEAYTALMTIAHAVAAAHSSTNVSALSKAMENVSFDSPTGFVHFDAHGQNTGASTQLWLVKNGTYVVAPNQ